MEPHMIEETRSCDMQPQLPPCPGCLADEPENCVCCEAPDDMPVPPPLVGASAPAVFSEGSGYLVEFSRAIEAAELQGFTVVRGGPRTILLDLDTSADIAHFDRTIGCLSAFLNIREVSRWASKSGEGMHVHLALKADLPVVERLLLQACLGSDRIHELLSLVSGVWKDNPEPTVLFKPGQKLLEASDAA